MILSDAGAGAGTLVMVTLYITGNLTIPALAAVAAVSGTFQAFQYPAYQAATTLLVPKERYSRASGMVQLAEAMGNLLAPVLGGIMIAVGGLGLLVAIDVVTFLFALGTLLAVRFPKPPSVKQERHPKDRSGARRRSASDTSTNAEGSSGCCSTSRRSTSSSAQ